MGMADGYSRVTNGVLARASLPCSMARAPKTLTLASRPLSRTASRSCSCRSATPSIARASRPCLLLATDSGPSRRASKSSPRPRARADTLRRAYAALRTGRLGPVVVEVPSDVAVQEATSDPRDVAVDPAHRLGRRSGGRACRGTSAVRRSAAGRAGGPGGPVRASVRPACRAGGVAESAGGDEPARQERIPRNARACAGLREPGDERARGGISPSRRPHPGGWLEPDAPRDQGAASVGRADRPRHQRPDRPAQGLRSPGTPSWATRGWCSTSSSRHVAISSGQRAEPTTRSRPRSRPSIGAGALPGRQRRQLRASRSIRTG